MYVLLVGSTGYLGSNVVYNLCQSGHEVFCPVRNESKAIELFSRKVNVLPFDLGEIALFIKKNKVDWIVNCLGAYSKNSSYEELLNANLVLPLSLMNIAVNNQVPYFLNIGTGLPTSTDDYSFSKNQFSEWGRFWGEKEKINFADFSVEMFYGGKNEPQDRFLPSCIKKFRNNETLLLTEGFQKRDIVRVEDVVAILNRVIESKSVSGYRKFSIGSGENHSIREIVSYMRTVTNSSSEVKYGAVPSRKNEPDTIADISWYSEIGYALKYSFFDGLREECLNRES